MRIIYLHQYFNTPEMSGSTRSFEIGRRLVAQGHSVEMITSLREPTPRKGWFTTDVAGMRVHWLPVPYSNQMSNGARMWAFARFAAGAARRAASLDGDVVFASSTPLTIAVPAVYASRRRRIPMVFEVRDLWPELPIAMGALNNPFTRSGARWLEHFAYANAERIVALSPGMVAGIERTGYPRSRIAMVPNASDLDFFKRDADAGRTLRRRIGVADNKILIAYTGTLGRINDVGYLVRVAAAARNDDRLVFLTVGGGQEKAMVEALAREVAVLNRSFHMLPSVSKREVAAVLSAADIAVSLVLPIPELEANSANKFFDGLAAGCCMAVNHGGWQAELLEATDSGIRLPYEPDAAAKMLRSLADDPCRIRNAGQNARRLAEERFSRDVLAAQVEAVMADAVGGSSRRVH